MRKVVYVLGAGASTDFCPEIQNSFAPSGKHSLPLSNDFFQKAIEADVINESANALLKYIEETKGLSFSDLKNGKPLSVEEIYTDLIQTIKVEMETERSPGRLIYANMTLDHAIEEIFQRARYHFGPCKNYSEFARHCVNTNSSIISFNWDTLLDEGLVNTGEWFYESGYGIKFNWLYVNFNKVNDQRRPSNVLLLKPHGSMNWFRYADFFSENKNGYAGDPVSDEERDWLGCYEFTKNSGIPRIQPKNRRLYQGVKFHPSLKMEAQLGIVPPRVDLNKTLINEIWEQAQKLIAEADEIIIIGYAMKETETRTCEVFKQGRNQNKKDTITVRLVMGKSDKPEGIECQAKKLFGPCNIKNMNMSFGEFSKCARDKA